MSWNREPIPYSQQFSFTARLSALRPPGIARIDTTGARIRLDATNRTSLIAAAIVFIGMIAFGIWYQSVAGTYQFSIGGLPSDLAPALIPAGFMYWLIRERDRVTIDLDLGSIRVVKKSSMFWSTDEGRLDELALYIVPVSLFRRGGMPSLSGRRGLSPFAGGFSFWSGYALVGYVADRVRFAVSLRKTKEECAADLAQLPPPLKQAYKREGAMISSPAAMYIL